MGAGGGLEVLDMAVSTPYAAAYLTAAQTPGGCAERREAAKESKHGGDVRSAGHTFIPVVWEHLGTMGPKGVEWFRRMVASGTT